MLCKSSFNYLFRLQSPQQGFQDEAPFQFDSEDDTTLLLDAINGDVMRAVLDINLVVPALWVAALARPLRRASGTVIGVLSARVGSIGDNQLGGWYSYRSSKAALNMFLKSAAIEYARRAPGVKLVAFHPGTTDTELSRPFQANVPAGKLFTTEFVAERLLTLLDDLEPDGELSYLDWAGSDIPW